MYSAVYWEGNTEASFFFVRLTLPVAGMLLALLIAAVVVAEARLSKPGRRLIKAPKHVTPRPPLTPEARRGIFPGNDEWASGYINFPSDGTMFHFFYWMVYSRNNKATDPTIFWFTGGPGCSSVLALLAENGAWQFTNPANISSLVVNP